MGVSTRRNYSILMFTGLGSIVLVAIVGTISYIFGYVFGERALQGVTPLFETGNPDGSPRNSSARGTIPLVLEVDVVNEIAPDLTPPRSRSSGSNPQDSTPGRSQSNSYTHTIRRLRRSNPGTHFHPHPDSSLFHTVPSNSITRSPGGQCCHECGICPTSRGVDRPKCDDAEQQRPEGAVFIQFYGCTG